MAAEGTIYNPIQQDRVTFLRLPEDIDGRYLLLETELAPGDGDTLHRHLSSTETFEVISGRFSVTESGLCSPHPVGDSGQVVGHRAIVGQVSVGT